MQNHDRNKVVCLYSARLCSVLLKRGYTWAMGACAYVVIWVLVRYFKAHRLVCYWSGGIYIHMRTIRDMGKSGCNEREEKYQGVTS
jgi:hypothetical protein